MNSAFKPSDTSWKQTWRTRDGRMARGWKRQWFGKLINLTHIYPLPANGDTVSLSARATKRYPKVPRMRNRDTHRWALPRIFAPVLLHWLYWKITGSNLNAIAAFIWYSLWFKFIGATIVWLWHGIGQQYGFLDGQKNRNGIPDDSIGKIVLSLHNTSQGRSAMLIALAYSSSMPPTFGWNILLQVALYPIILDYWFYIYHRSMHDYRPLWKFHRTHHLAKHPNTLLTLFADAEQEVYDILISPLLTFLTMRQFSLLSMSFYDWWVCSMYQAIIEVGGHSGVRVHAGPFAAGFGLLDKLGVGLIVEDHDLHHRKGYRASGNYGKQTLIWDKLFGTVIPREECIEGNVDFNELVSVPW
ncbi:unnamed protein product [Sympodiomycopsis kandeliae]